MQPGKGNAGAHGKDCKCASCKSKHMSAALKKAHEEFKRRGSGEQPENPFNRQR